MNPIVEIIFMIASVIVSAIILYYVYGFRRECGVGYLIGVVICRIILAIGVILEKNSYEFMEKLVFRNVSIPCCT